MSDDQAAPDDAPEAGGWAVYDETLHRFTTGVMPTKKAAQAVARSAPKGHTIKVRKV